jgi:hypothetical protein
MVENTFQVIFLMFVWNMVLFMTGQRHTHHNPMGLQRENHTLTDLVNAMLETSGLSKEWWGEAILTSCHVLNKVPTKYKQITPFEEWENRKLNISYLRTWGCLAKVNVPINKKRKLGPKIVDCVFLGYAFHNIGYRFLILNSRVPYMLVGTIMESRDATFFEDKFPMKVTHDTCSDEPTIPHEHFIPVEHTEESHIHTPMEDENVSTQNSKRQGLQSPLVMITLYILWMTPQVPLKRHTPLLMLTFGRKQ